MQDLRVIGVEGGALLVASDDGERFRIAIDEVLQSKLRQTVPDPGLGRKLAPREIQAHIRSGMSAEDVSAVTGVPLDYIQKFEGPVLAEREFVIQTALNVVVHTAADTDPMSQGTTFGTVIRQRLLDLGAIGERWASWKEQGGSWIVKLAFTADQIDHDARWSFDPRKQALGPLNAEAITLSQQGETSGPLIPRLRAVGADEWRAEQSRFDSGAFDVHEGVLHDTDTGQQLHSISRGSLQNPKPEGFIHDNSQTADLLEALRRRRGEREAAHYEAQSEAMAQHPSTGTIRVIDVPVDTANSDDTGPIGKQNPKRGRASMPSWDEIVFGSRTDDDPA